MHSTTEPSSTLSTAPNCAEGDNVIPFKRPDTPSQPAPEPELVLSIYHDASGKLVFRYPDTQDPFARFDVLFALPRAAQMEARLVAWDFGAAMGIPLSLNVEDELTREAFGLEDSQEEARMGSEATQLQP